MIKEFLERLKNDEDNQLKKQVYRYLATFIGILGLFIAFGILFPTAAAMVLNIVWITLFAVVVTFLTLGVLVVFGLRKEVSEILDVIFEGSLSVIDAIELLKKMWERFKQMAREFIVYAAPVVGYIIALIVYIGVLVAYKTIGRNYDVTIFTVVLTFLLVLFVGFLNRPNKNPTRPMLEWIRNFISRFHRGFTDGLEVVLFIFFMTMDSTNLFFLPAHLNNPLTAQWGDYNLMHRGFDLSDHARITLTLVIITITVEICRHIIKLIAMSRKYYREILEQDKVTGEVRSKYQVVKESVRMAFGEAKDDLVRFITFTSVLLLVFLLFPRLKLLTLVVASLTGLLLDFVITGRLTIRRGEDLISRILAQRLNI